jgi:hypothetical protein
VQRLRSHEGHYGTWHTTLWSCTHIPNIIDLSRKTKMLGLDKKILFKKQLFDLEDKDQGPTKVITVCDTPPYGHAPTYQISLTYPERQKCYGPTRKYYIFFYLTLRSKVEVPQRSLWYVRHRLMVMHPNTKYNWPISKDTNVIVWTRKYYLKTNYLTLRTKVKVPWRCFRYVTHRLMVMHPHTK